MLIDNCRCITCEEGYFLKNYQCLKCDPNCKTCINKDNYCTSCNNTKFLYNNSCIDYDDNSYNNLNYLKIEKENEIKYYDEILYSIESLFTSDFFKTKDLDDGDDIFIKTEKINIYLTTIEIQKKRKDENITTIDLGKCEILLRDYYNISDDELLYMKILEIYQEHMKIKKIEYNIYSKLNGTNLVKLDFSICQVSKIFISYPIEITENFDILNTSSGYYNDICYSTTSESGTDISLKDRKNIFIEKNKAVCQDYCVFSDYNHTNKKANCSCKARESHISFADMKINKDKLFENLININNIANLNILICYKKLFNINGILFNIGNYIIATIILFHIISFFIFYLKQYGLIKNKIKVIICNIKKSIVTKRKNNKIINKKVNKNVGDQKMNNRNKNLKIKIIKNNNNNRRIIRFKNNVHKKANNKTIKLDWLKPPIYKIKEYINFMKKLNANKKINNFKNNDRKKKPVINLSNNKKSNYIITKNVSLSKSNFQRNIKRNINILKYSSEEKNELPYNLAIKNDKRTYCQYYLSLLKLNHDFIFSFIYSKDYNSKIIKIDLFFISFAINYFVNGLFFDDGTMHKIYETNGSFNLEYKLPNILYSSLISIIFNKILKELALSNKSIIRLREAKKAHDADKMKTKVEKTLCIKYPFYFILGFILLIFIWYYLSMFGVIYRNTQYHLIKDTLVGYGLSLIYPFFIFLLPGIFRIPSLSNPRKKRVCLYNSSKALQIL